MDCEEIEDVFPHINLDNPRFSLFNFFHLQKAEQAIGKYYKNLVYPYEKYYLEDKESYFERYEQLETSLNEVKEKIKLHGGNI